MFVKVLWKNIIYIPKINPIIDFDKQSIIFVTTFLSKLEVISGVIPYMNHKIKQADNIVKLKTLNFLAFIKNFSYIK